MDSTTETTSDDQLPAFNPTGGSQDAATGRASKGTEGACHSCGRMYGGLAESYSGSSFADPTPKSSCRRQHSQHVTAEQVRSDAELASSPADCLRDPQSAASGQGKRFTRTSSPDGTAAAHPCKPTNPNRPFPCLLRPTEEGDKPLSPGCCASPSERFRSRVSPDRAGSDTKERVRCHRPEGQDSRPRCRLRPSR